MILYHGHGGDEYFIEIRVVGPQGLIDWLVGLPGKMEKVLLGSFLLLIEVNKGMP